MSSNFFTPPQPSPYKGEGVRNLQMIYDCYIITYSCYFVNFIKKQLLGKPKFYRGIII